MSAGWWLFLALAGGVLSLMANKLPRVALAFTLAAAFAALLAALTMLVGGTAWEWRSAVSIGGEPLHLRLDALSAVFLALPAVVGGVGAIYSCEYWNARDRPASAGAGRCWWALLLLSMGAVLTVSNGLHFLIVWEMFALSGFFLIRLERKRPEVCSAAWLYLAASHAGTLALFGLFATLAAQTGSWDLVSMQAREELAPLFWLALFGFGMKAGFFPLHIWLPSAHASAPSHVSAIMSGVGIKMGLYGIVRFSGWLPLPAGSGWVVLGLGAISAVLGIAFSLAQNDLKRLLAYSSVENMGVILIGLGASLLARTHGDAAWGRLALAGALLHVWNHGAFKPLLFFGAGSVLHATGTREMSRLGGLWRTMPWTAALFAVGVAAVAGLPPLNGFVSEWLIYLGLFDAAGGMQASATALAAIPLGIAGALALACFTKAGAMIFLGAPRTRLAAGAHECGPWMRRPMIGLAGLCVVMGLAPGLFWPVILRAVAAWQPGWAGEAPRVPLAMLSSVNVCVITLEVLCGVLLWRKVRRRNLRRDLTWDCGYATPRPRMQYTGGSFGATVSAWFVWILVPVRRLRRPRGFFPRQALRLEHTPETVLERVMKPAGARLLRMASAVRRLQHGRLQAYVLYLLCGLLALGMLVLMGGDR